MDPTSDRYACDRCRTEFSITATHTEVVRRDFVDAPQPSRIERFCADCWEAYVEEFLGRDFDAQLDAYATDR